MLPPPKKLGMMHDGRSLWYLRFRQLNERCMQLLGKARSQLKDTVGSTDTVRRHRLICFCFNL